VIDVDARPPAKTTPSADVRGQFVLRTEAEVGYRPIRMAPVFAASGGLPLAQRPKQRQAYRLMELKRWRRRLDVPLNLQPAHFPVDEALAAGMVIAHGQRGGDVGRLSQAMMTAVWAEQRDLADRSTLLAIAAEQVFHLDDGIAFETAAAFPLVFETAYRMLVTREAVREGDWALIWGIGGGVATAAFELCRAFGVRTIVTSGSPEKLASAREWGADVVVNHYEDDVVQAVKEATDHGADVVVETVGEATWARTLAAVRPAGRVVVCGATSGPNPPANLHRFWWKQLTVLGSTMGTREDFLGAYELVRSGRARVHIDRVFPLGEAPAAHARLEAGEQLPFEAAVVRKNHHAPLLRAKLDLFARQPLAVQTQDERRAHRLGREVFHVHHDLGWRGLGVVAPHFEADNGDVILAAIDLDEVEMSASLGEFVGARKRAVTQHDHAIRAAALEKRMGEQNRLFDAPGRIRGFQAARQFAQAALVGGERNQQARLYAGADHHHSLSGAEMIDQTQQLPSRGVEARGAAPFRFHAGAQVDDHDQVAGRATKVAQPGIG